MTTFDDDRDLDSLLSTTAFDADEYYSVSVGTDGLIVYSECCADTMSRETAAKVHEALGRYLEATEEGS